MRIGLCNGCFDLFHEGHRFFLEQARSCCDYLIVAVNTDQSVRWLKGENRPIDLLKHRMRWCQPHADAVIPFDGDGIKLVEMIRPDVLIRGADQSSEGGSFASSVQYIIRLPNFSTTQQIKDRLQSPHA